MPQIPFAFQWTISENQFLPLKDSDNGFLKSTKLTNIPEFKYYLQISPNGHNDHYRGQTIISLQLEFKNVKKVETDFTFKIEAANYSCTSYRIYNKIYGWGPCICSTEEFFDPEKKFIFDGKFTVKVNGIFKYETRNAVFDVIQEQKWIGGKLGDEFWKKDDSKDFTIITSDGNEIKVHKCVLDVRSEVFTAMLKTAAATENKLTIPDFSFAVVETALKIIYDCNFISSLSQKELRTLLYFFYEFDLPVLKADVEQLLIEKISPTTICRLANISVKTNSIKLKEKCMEFLLSAFQSKTAIADIDELDKNIALQILEKSQRQTSETDINTSDAAVTEQKWEGGELGDKLWNDHETKDFTINVDGKEIKAHKFILGVQSQMFKKISKETNENEAEIFNFSSKVVKTGIKLIYECNFISKLSMDELMLLLQFFDQYQLPTLKAKIEPYLINQISASTVVRLVNCSILTNSTKLKEKCIEFLSTAFKSKIPLSDIKILNKDIAVKILENSLYQHLETKK